MKRPLEPKIEARLRAAEIAHRPDFRGELRAATASRISRSRRLAIRVVSSRGVKSATPTPFFDSGAIQSVSSKGSVVRYCSAAPRAAGRALASLLLEGTATDSMTDRTSSKVAVRDSGRTRCKVV